MRSDLLAMGARPITEPQFEHTTGTGRNLDLSKNDLVRTGRLASHRHSQVGQVVGRVGCMRGMSFQTSSLNDRIDVRQPVHGVHG
jgi:hypothetical protein